MSDPFVAEIRIFPFNQFSPNGWAYCNGQLMNIAQNTALFSLLGTMYGGNGQTTFGLPNLTNSVPMFWGQGKGLSLHDIGEAAGTPTVTLKTSQIPAHPHVLQAAPFVSGDTNIVTGNSLAKSSNGNVYAPYKAPVVQLAAVALQNTGGNGAHNNMQPFMTLCFNIALQGIYPARS
jgi:microcystin-dependent protein